VSNIVTLPNEPRRPSDKAYAAFEQEDMGYGSFLSHDWIYSRFEMYPPDRGSAEDFKSFGLNFLGEFDEFRQTLLFEKRMCLISVHGKGWTVLEPQDQTAVVFSDMMRNIGKILRKGRQRLRYVNHDMLSSDQRKQNADALAKTATLQSIARKTKGAFGKD